MSNKITLKDIEFEFDDIIKLTKFQLNKINKKSHTKSFDEWDGSKNGIKIKLIDEQVKKILEEKNNLLLNKTIEQIKKKIVRFDKHASEQISIRLEGKREKGVAEEETIERVIELLKNTEKVNNKATWKGEDQLRYGFFIDYFEIKSEVIVNFDKKKKMLIITVVVDKMVNTPFNGNKSLLELKKRLENKE